MPKKPGPLKSLIPLEDLKAVLAKIVPAVEPDRSKEQGKKPAARKRAAD